MVWAVIKIYTSKCAQMDPQQIPKTSKFYSKSKKCDIEKTLGGGYHPLGSPKVKTIRSTASTTHSSLALKQSACDKPLLDNTVADLLDRQLDQTNQARLNAILAPHDEDWVLALSITSSGLRDSDLMTRRSGLRRACASGSRSADLMDGMRGLGRSRRSPRAILSRGS